MTAKQDPVVRRALAAAEWDNIESEAQKRDPKFMTTADQRRKRSESRDAALVNETLASLPERLTNANARMVAAAIDRLTDVLSRRRFKTGTVTTPDGVHTVRIVEGRLPTSDGEGALALVGAAAKLKRLLESPGERRGSVETPDGTHHMTVRVHPDGSDSPDRPTREERKG